jgi:hypothetical protein
VKRSAPDLEEMLVHSKGVRQVPVILENGGTTIGRSGFQPEHGTDSRGAAGESLHLRPTPQRLPGIAT